MSGINLVLDLGGQKESKSVMGFFLKLGFKLKNNIRKIETRLDFPRKIDEK